MSNITNHFSSREIIAEIETEFSDYAQYINMPALFNKLTMLVKEFRDLVCIPTWSIVHINGGEGDLPKEFRSFISGAIVSPDTCYSPSLAKERIVLSRQYTEIEEFIFTTDGCMTCSTETCEDRCVTSQGDRIVETRVIEERPVFFTYNNPSPLRVVGHKMNKDLLSKYYESYDSEYDISIYGGKAHVNFDKGVLLINYNALKVDEKGLPVIPEGGDDSMRDYITTALKVHLYESPKMLSQQGFADFAKMLWANTKAELYIKKAAAKDDLARLQKRHLLEYNKMRKQRVNNFFVPYSLM